MQSGDLPAGKSTAEQIVFSIAATAIGSHIMARNTHVLMMAGIEDPLRALCQNVSVLLDGLNWKPLLSEWDYDAVYRRIKDEVFPEATWFKG